MTVYCHMHCSDVVFGTKFDMQELCMSRRWPPPTYDLSHEEVIYYTVLIAYCLYSLYSLYSIHCKCSNCGYSVASPQGLPHERSFTIKCIIEGKHLEVGAGKSKKLAKRQAANKMIQVRLLLHSISGFLLHTPCSMLKAPCSMLHAPCSEVT